MAHELTGEALLAYVAGIIDGEGTIGLHTNYKNPSAVVTVNVGNTNEWLIRFLKMNFGGYICYQPREEGSKWKDIWRWELRAKKVIEFIKQILPYLQLKYPQAEIVITFQERRTGKRLTPEVKILDDIDKSLMHKLNYRGIPQEEA